jgi:hypothetical protein
MSHDARLKLAGRIGAALAVTVVSITVAAGAQASSSTTTLYVASTGNDANACTQSAPCATITHALSVGASAYSASNAVAISVGAGTFDGQLIPTYPVSIEGAGPAATVIDVTSTSDGCTKPYAVFISSVAHSCGTDAAMIAGAYAISGVTVEGVAGVATSATVSHEPFIVDIGGLAAGTSVALTNDDFVASSSIDANLATDQTYGVYAQPGPVSSTTSSITIEGDSFSGMSVGAIFNPYAGQLTVADNDFAGLASSDTSSTNYQTATGVLSLDAVQSTAPMVGDQIISDNTFEGYAGYGVKLDSGYNGNPGTIENVAITGNTFDLPVWTDPQSQTTGLIYLGDTSSTGTSVLSNISVTGNSMTATGTGAMDVQVDVGAGQTFSGNLVEGNDLLGRSGVIGVNEPTAPTVTATDNYWGDPSGPSGQGAGTGTAASTGVDYSPWWNTPNGAPTAPTNVTASPGVDDAVVSWTAALSGTSDGAIASYTVTASAGGASTTVPGSATSATVSGLTPGDSYQFAVSATGGTETGPSATSTGVTVLAATTPTPTPTPPPAPTATPAPAPTSTPTSTPTPTPTPAGIAPATLGTPVTAIVQAASPTTLAETSGSARATMSIPAGALPSDSVVSIYPVVNATTLISAIRTGQAYLTSVAVSWQAPDGASPTALAPITITIDDHGIAVGDTVYELTSAGRLTPVGVAKANGVVTITFDGDPVFVIAAVPNLTLAATPAKATKEAIDLKLHCTASASCHASATLRLTVKTRRGHKTVVTHVTVASARFAIAKDSTATINLRMTKFGRTVLARRTPNQRLHLNLATTMTGAARSVKSVLLPRTR